MLKNLWRTTQVPQTRVYLKYILILLKFVFTILFTILICRHSLHPRSCLLYRLETELYNHVHVNCSTSRHKTTAVVGGPWVGWSLMASLWHTEKQGTLGRKGNYGKCMDLKWGLMEEMCSNKVKGGKKNQLITIAAFILFSIDTYV